MKTSHITCISKINRLMFNTTKNKNKNYFCRCCLQWFRSENVLTEHKENCLVINGKQNVKLGKGSISFKNYSKQLPATFKIYSDFEFILRPTSSKRVKSSDKNGSYTEKYQDQIPCTFAFKVVCVDNKFSKDVVMYRGKNTAYKFIEVILEEYDYCKRIMEKYFNKNLVMSVDEEEKFQLANSCWICNKLFDVGDEKVRDHCHVTGKYRGAAHFSSNTNCKLSKKVPAIFHNMRGYDSHLIIKEIYKFDLKVSVIPNGLEKYMAFTINKNLVFIVSMQFMNSGLVSLVKNLSNNDFRYLSEEFSVKYLELVKEKGVHPYEYMDSFKKLSVDKLPDKSKFFSYLKDGCISEKDYQRANNVWNEFKMKTIGDYHDLYLKTDVLLLADVFEKFIKTCLDYYELDPCHYFSSSGLSWDAMLKMTEVELELISDIEMHLFMEKGIRGGVSYIAKRHNKANNKYMKDYDGSECNSIEESVYIIYLDANNLYGRVIIQYLLYGGFKWLSKEEIDDFDLNLVKENSLPGYILKVDLEYPSELHDLPNDYPLAPEKLKISQNMLSKYVSDIVDEYGIKVGGVNKLVPNLGNKSKYVVHYRNLQLNLSLGMKLSKIHII